ncbi:hypothetical protein BC827DRAFT_140602 [Russula dissimulans]|nr:hypothetical protein BC827DRAFT_140602 [Russula dissimulans]
MRDSFKCPEALSTAWRSTLCQSTGVPLALRVCRGGRNEAGRARLGWEGATEMGNEPAPARGLGCGHMSLRTLRALRPIFFPPNHHQHFPPIVSHLLSRCESETWLVPADVLIVAAVRRVFVLLPWLCRRRVPCVQTHVPTAFFLFFFVVRGAVLTGTASFFTHSYISTGRNQIIVYVVTRALSNSWTPGCELPKGRNAYLVNIVSFRSDPLDRA